MAERRRRIAGCARAGDRSQNHQRRQCDRRRCPPRRQRSTRRTARLGSDAVRRAGRYPAQGRPRSGRQSGRVDSVDRARNRRHSGQGGFRNPPGDRGSLSLRRHVHRAAGRGVAVQSRPHQHRAADAARCRRHHLAVQFPADPFDARRRTGTRDRQYGGAQTGSTHRHDRRLHYRQSVRGSRLAQGRAPRPARRRRGRRGAVHRSRHRHGVVHRIEQCRPPYRRTGRQASQEGSARTRRQERGDRPRRRRSRCGRFGDCVRRLVPSGSDLHDDGPHLGPRQDRQIADGETGRQGEPSAGRRSAGASRARTSDLKGAGRNASTAS